MKIGRALGALLFGSWLSVAAWACSSAPPPTPREPVTTVPAASALPPPVPSASSLPATAATETSPPPVSDPATPPVASAPPEPAAPTTETETTHLTRSPVDILTAPDTAFLIDWTGSAPIQTARASCAEKSGGDAAAQAKCLSDARDAFKADVIRFRKDGSHWAWTVYKRAGNRLDEVASGRVTLTEASPSSVSVKFVTDKGLRPLLKNKREAVLTVPNDYSFEIDDAEWGSLKYEAKIGLVAN